MDRSSNRGKNSNNSNASGAGRGTSQEGDISDLLRRAVEQMRVRQEPVPPPIVASAPSGNSISNQNDLTAALLQLLLTNGGVGQQQPAQDSNNNNSNNNNNSDLLALLLQPPQQALSTSLNANNSLAVENSGGTDLRSANLQAQALLREQEDALRETRLMLQRQIERMDGHSQSSSTEQAAAPAAAAAARPGQQSDASVDDEEDERKPPAEVHPDEDVSEEGEGERDPEAIYDDDELDDDAYFEGFDKEDSHKINNETFPFRLYRMLYEVEKAGKQDIASFSVDGKMFCVRKPKRFVNEIMPEYFTTSRLASFQRQLNLYGFNRISDGAHRGSYHHPFFRKGKRALCRKIKRQRTRPKPNGNNNNNNARNSNSNSGSNTNSAAAATATTTTGNANAAPAQAASVLPATSNQQNSLSFANSLPLLGSTANLNNLIFSNPGAAAELLQRSGIERTLESAGLLRGGALSARDFSLGSILESANPRQGLGTLPNLAAPAPAANILAALQNNPSLRNALMGNAQGQADTEAQQQPPLDLRSALLITQLQRENQELTQRLQAEQEQRRRRDPS